jgi:hypothetical protein
MLVERIDLILKFVIEYGDTGLVPLIPQHLKERVKLIQSLAEYMKAEQKHLAQRL